MEQNDFSFGVVSILLHILLRMYPPPPPHSLQGLKTGMYYLRTKAAANAIQFTVDQKVVQEARDKTAAAAAAAGGLQNGGLPNGKDYKEQAMACSIQNKEACTVCSA